MTWLFWQPLFQRSYSEATLLTLTPPLSPTLSLSSASPSEWCLYARSVGAINGLVSFYNVITCTPLPTCSNTHTLPHTRTKVTHEMGAPAPLIRAIGLTVLRVINRTNMSVSLCMYCCVMYIDLLYTVFHKKTVPLVILLYLYFYEAEFHENLYEYTRGIGHYDHEINIRDSFNYSLLLSL